MSEILNELDGIESTDGCIRFFTCNDIDEVKKHDALINRMNCFSQYFMTLFNEKTKIKNITLRQFTTFIIRYLFDDKCLDKMIENINELFE